MHILKTASVILLYTLLQNTAALAVEMNPRIAARQALIEHLQPPKPDPDGRVQTLNKKGAMSPKLDQISREFVEFAATPNVRVLEIGAGYGLACMEALELGAKNYTANDLDERHLKILAANVNAMNSKYLNRIHLVAGSYQDEVELKNDYYDAILIARVLHFMTPEEVDKTLSKAYALLKPGGKIYAVMLSPYVKGYASFIPEFEERVEEGHPNPGYVENLLAYSDRSIIPENALKNLEKSFFFFDTRTAIDHFTNSGFIVEKAVEMPLAYHSQIWMLDGRENVGIVASKP